MKAVFAHDHRFVQTKGAVYTDVHFPAAAWARYLEFFDELVVAGRAGDATEHPQEAGLIRSSVPGVCFEFFENLTSLRGLTAARRTARLQMNALVAQADAVIARLPSEIGLLAIDCAREHNKPYAVEVVACPWDGFLHYGSMSGTLYAPIIRARMRRAVRKAPFAIYVTQHFLQSRYPSAGFTAAVSDVSIREPDEAVLAKRLLHQGTAQDRPMKLGLVGTLNGRFKGIQTVLEALKAMGADKVQYRFHVLGPGDAGPWKHLAAQLGVDDLVHFEGTRANGEAVLEWLDDIDLYLQPSLKEGLPRALIEAMSRGCPALGSSAAGIPELLDAEDLITPGAGEELAKLIASRAGDPDWMMDRARRNWLHAGQYADSHLEARRKAFWGAFAQFTQSSIGQIIGKA